MIKTKEYYGNTKKRVVSAGRRGKPSEEEVTFETGLFQKQVFTK